jgi:hypothetical protein
MPPACLTFRGAAHAKFTRERVGDFYEPGSGALAHASYAWCMTLPEPHLVAHRAPST